MFTRFSVDTPHHCTDTARSRSTQHSVSLPVASSSSSPLPLQRPSPHTQPLRRVSHACAPCTGHLRLVLTFVFVYTHATERVSDFCNRCIHRPTLSALTTTANRRKEDFALVSIALKAPQSVLSRHPPSVMDPWPRSMRGALVTSCSGSMS